MNRSTAIGTTLALLLSVPALAACDNGGSDEEKAVKETAEKAMHAMGNKDGKGICETMTTKDGSKPLKEDQAQTEECTKSMALLSMAPDDKLSGYKNAKVKKATVNGDTATIKESDVEGMPPRTGPSADKPAEDLRLKKINGSWYIDNTAKADTSATAMPSK